MKHTATTLTILATSLVAGATALADPGSSAPRPPQELQVLRRMVGEWRGNATLAVGDRKDPARMSVSCKATAAGYAVSCQTRFTLPGGRIVEETDLFGWDPGEKVYHWFAVTSSGNTHNHVARAPLGDTWTFAHSGLDGGQPMHEIIRLRPSADGKRIEAHTTCAVEGRPDFELKVSLVRQ